MIQISKKHREIIEESFKQIKIAEDRKNRLYKILKGCTDDEAICMKYLYAFMPKQDLDTYDEELFLKIVRQVIKTKELTSWGGNINGSIFLNYVLQYRVNNENIEFYQEEFFNELYPHVKDLTMYEAVLEVNYWCFEKATYQSTDIRTASPFTVLKNAYGRCGEESTLTVAALRSIGIPARQVYTPRWAHCDDNHAWVEVWIDGRWHFLGACEPDALLDKGWFMLSASKGMLIHNKVFSTLVEDERITVQSESATEINLLSHYAQTKEITVEVKDAQGNEVEDATVSFEIINYAELFSIAKLKTDKQGKAKFLTGLGDLVIYVYKEDKRSWKQVDVRLEDRIEIILEEKKAENTAIEYITLVPPVGGVKEDEGLTETQKKTHEEKNAKALKNRELFKGTFYVGERAKTYAKDYEVYETDVVQALEKALGNYQEIIDFLQDEETIMYIEDKINLFGTLSKKDFTDITCDILKEHLLEALKHKNRYDDQELFVSYVLAPRIDFEMIRNYRKKINEYFTADEIQAFRESPNKIYEFITQEIEETLDSSYSTLYTSVLGVLESRRGNAISRKILFVAICRALGIPAKLKKEDKKVAYYKEARWIELGENKIKVKKTSQLVLEKERKQLDFEYFKNYTVGKLENDVYVTLNLEEISWEEDSISYEVEAGCYRVVTTNRQIDGSILASLYYVDIAEATKVKLSIDITEKKQKVIDVDIADIVLKTLDGRTEWLSEVIEETHNIIAYLDISAEPTEHLLNEMLESKEKYNRFKPAISFIIDKTEALKNKTLQKVLLEIQHIKVYVGIDRDYLSDLYKCFSIEDKKLPIVYTMNKAMKAQYVWVGYNVGVGELLLKYIYES